MTLIGRSEFWKVNIQMYHSMESYRTVEIYLHALSSKQTEMNGWLHALATFTRGKSPSVGRIGDNVVGITTNKMDW